MRFGKGRTDLRALDGSSHADRCRRASELARNRWARPFWVVRAGEPSLLGSFGGGHSAHRGQRAVQGAVNSKNSSGSVVISPSTANDVMTEVLRGTLNISPTVTKAPGDRIRVFVARDVDFRTVYALRVANSPATPDGNP